MSNLTLKKIRLRNGVWEGRLSGGSGLQRPEIQVKYLDLPVESVSVIESDEPGSWDVSIPIPTHAVADGVQTFVIYDTIGETKLGDFTLIAGEAISDDLRAEMELLRAELDMLKRAFRRHCLETM